MYSCHLFLISSTFCPYHSCPLSHPFLHEMFPWYLQFSWKDLLSFPFYYFPLLLCTVHWRRPSYVSLPFSRTLHSVGYIFPFRPCFSLLFFPQLFVKPSQTTTLLSCISLSLGWFQSLPLVPAMLRTSVHNSSGTLSTRSNPLNLFLTTTV